MGWHGLAHIILWVGMVWVWVQIRRKMLGSAMHQKMKLLIFFNTCSKRAILEKKIKFDHSLVFSWVSLVFTSCQMCQSCGLQIFSHNVLQRNEQI
jgi:hypothetical protein